MMFLSENSDHDVFFSRSSDQDDDDDEEWVISGYK